ncbi:hypothetical protein B0H13DRAFT_2511784 [Mycena leptocephala]|nr:hypothetical protein B0H13DRAFT_2511784 [Mycena leptocephala]
MREEDECNAEPTYHPRPARDGAESLETQATSSSDIGSNFGTSLLSQFTSPGCSLFPFVPFHGQDLIKTPQFRDASCNIVKLLEMHAPSMSSTFQALKSIKHGHRSASTVKPSSQHLGYAPTCHPSGLCARSRDTAIVLEIRSPAMRFTVPRTTMMRAAERAIPHAARDYRPPPSAAIGQDRYPSLIRAQERRVRRLRHPRFVSGRAASGANARGLWRRYPLRPQENVPRNISQTWLSKKPPGIDDA